MAAVQGIYVLDLFQGDSVVDKYEAWLKRMDLTHNEVFQKIMSEPTLTQVGSQRLQAVQLSPLCNPSATPCARKSHLLCS